MNLYMGFRKVVYQVIYAVYVSGRLYEAEAKLVVGGFTRENKGPTLGVRVH